MSRFEAHRGIEIQLPIASWRAGQFVRISRSALVNLAAIAAVRSKSHGDQTLELRSGSLVTVARTCRAEVLARLGRLL